MELRKLLTIFSCLLFITAPSEDSHHALAQDDHQMDWFIGHATVKARGHARKTGSPADIDNAIEAAKVEAQAKLLETIKGVQVDSDRTVLTLMKEARETTAKVQGVLRNAFLLGEPQIEESKDHISATVEMAVCLYENGVRCPPEKSLSTVIPASFNSRNDQKRGCTLTPSISASQQIVREAFSSRSVPPEIVIINSQGMPFNINSRDFIIEYLGENGTRCFLYSPDMIDPAIRRDRGSMDIALNQEIALNKYGSNTIQIESKRINHDNKILIDYSDAYILNIINISTGHNLFKKASFVMVINP